MLRHSVAHDGWLVNIVTADKDLAEVQPLADILQGKYANVVSVVNNITASKAGVAIGEYEVHLTGEPCLKEQLGAYEFDISANSFFQTNTRGAVALYDTVKDFCPTDGQRIAYSIYTAAPAQSPSGCRMRPRRLSALKLWKVRWPMPARIVKRTMFPIAGLWQEISGRWCQPLPRPRMS